MRWVGLRNMEDMSEWVETVEMESRAKRRTQRKGGCKEERGRTVLDILNAKAAKERESGVSE